MKKNLILICGGLSLVVCVSVVALFSIRQLSLAITTVDVIEVEPGVRCARMVTADGAAISCWKVGGGE